MARKLTAKGGPIDGKTVIVHETQKTFTHHGDPDGHYKVDEKSVTWQPNTKPVEETERVETPAPKPARRPARPKAPKPQASAPADAPVEQTESRAER